MTSKNARSDFLDGRGAHVTLLGWLGLLPTATKTRKKVCRFSDQFVPKKGYGGCVPNLWVFARMASVVGFQVMNDTQLKQLTYSLAVSPETRLESYRVSAVQTYK
jgi:hypothetical protein